MPSSPAHRFKQTISYALLTGRDSYGKPTMSAATAAKARVQPMRRLMRDARGAEFLSTHVIYTTAAIDLNHRLWLPGESTADFNLARRVGVVDVMIDGAGVERFRKVVLG